jgi:hypothetical protein
MSVAPTRQSVRSSKHEQVKMGVYAPTDAWCALAEADIAKMNQFCGD